MARRPSTKGKPESGRAKHFFFEFLSVTLGVLIALILEQAATSWRERQRVTDLRVTMNGEIADSGDIYLLRARLSPCVIRKLDALEIHLRGGGPPAPVHDIGRPNFFFSSKGGWNSDASDQLSRYLGAEQFMLYAQLYQAMEQYSSLSADEQDAWVVLQTLEGDADAMTPDRRARLREAIALARNKNLLLTAIAEQMLPLARQIGVQPSRALQKVVPVETKPICKPLRAS